MPDLQTPAQPFTDPGDLLAELADLDTLTADVFGPDVPLRDRVAVLVADWQDSTELLNYLNPDAEDRQVVRRGLEIDGWAS